MPSITGGGKRDLLISGTNMAREVFEGEAVQLTQAALHFYVSSQQNPEDENIRSEEQVSWPPSSPTSTADTFNRTSSRNILG